MLKKVLMAVAAIASAKVFTLLRLLATVKNNESD
jgi:hypothetical protein